MAGSRANLGHTTGPDFNECDLRRLLQAARGHPEVETAIMTRVPPIGTAPHLLLFWRGLGLDSLQPSWVPLTRISTITSLDVSRNSITRLDVAVISLLPELCHLNISHNSITRLPSETEWCEGGWIKLASLVMSDNGLSRYVLLMRSPVCCFVGTYRLS